MVATTICRASVGCAASQRPMISSDVAGAVDVGGVDEVAAGGDVVVDEPVRGRLVGLRAEGHGAEAEAETTQPLLPSFR